ncbi:MAG: ATP synthase F1 subunit epsilon [Bacteroidetes bacterium CG2_30_33_31]|nr:MAG: ATP synthase F1 subunit epsilon [Bacteroidetes bacterium CG2_30_33_31]
MNVEIISPDKSIFKGELNLIQLPGIDGSFEIMDHHAPLVSILKKGKIKLVDAKKKVDFIEINGGVIEVLNNYVKILVE